MGVVWRARDQLLDRDVAVKEVVISALIGAEERRNAYQRTLREARTAARLSHRGVVAVYDVAEEDGRPWIIMELVPSRSLDQVLSVERRLPTLRTGQIGQQLLSALAAAHAAGVLHRDVKPSNVLIATDRSGSGWDERAVLTDFGIAQFEGDPRLTQTGMVMGSPGFTAPERIRGGDATSASDLWSLGATLFAAVEGRGPYEQRGGAITTMSAIINEDAPAAVHAGPLAAVIGALLRRDPSARPSASAAARMFTQVLPLLTPVSDGARQTVRPATVQSAYVHQPTELVAPSQPAPPADTTPGGNPQAPEPAAEPEAEPPAADPPEAEEHEPAAASGGEDRENREDAAELEPDATRPVPAAEPVPDPGEATVIEEAGPGSGYRPTELSVPVAKPAPAPTFTASRPGQRVSPSPARGAAQPHTDLATQYPPGTGGGHAQRRKRPWRRIALLLCAVVIAAAIGTAVAFALHRNGAGSPKTDPLTRFGSVNALNRPSAASPAGWTHTQVTAAEAQSTAGFTVDLPPGWTEYRRGLATDFNGPNDMLFDVDLTPHTKSDMVQEALSIESQSAPSFTGYERRTIAAVPVRSANGAIWQFTRTSASGVTLLADDILFVKPTPAGQQSYAVFVRAPRQGWGAIYLPAFEQILHTFQTLPAS